MFVRLILAGGINAGTVAEIKEGFYLVGRSEECQIRSESPSVSDRHCLLQHKGKYFRVVVLNEESPTQVNHKPLKPKEWVLLNHGDMLQIGRIPFLVAITAEDPSLPAAATGKSHSARPSAPQPTAPTSAAEDFASKDTAEIEAEELGSDTPSHPTSPTDGRWKQSDEENPKQA